YGRSSKGHGRGCPTRNRHGTTACLQASRRWACCCSYWEWYGSRYRPSRRHAPGRSRDRSRGPGRVRRRGATRASADKGCVTAVSSVIFLPWWGLEHEQPADFVSQIEIGVVPGEVHRGPEGGDRFDLLGRCGCCHVDHLQPVLLSRQVEITPCAVNGAAIGLRPSGDDRVGCSRQREDLETGPTRC